MRFLRILAYPTEGLHLCHLQELGGTQKHFACGTALGSSLIALEPKILETTTVNLACCHSLELGVS